MGIKSGIGLDLFGVNLLVMLAYSFTNKGLYIYWIVPIYAIYKIVKFLQPYCCNRSAATDSEENDAD